MAHAVTAIRALFPILQGDSLHYLDNAAMTQLPEPVLAAVNRYETTMRANVQRGVYRLAESSTAAYEQARASVAHYLNAGSADEVIFTAGTTAAINLLALSLAARLQPGDEVVVSMAEHHSNLVPWQLLRDRCGIVLRFIPLRAEGVPDLDNLDSLVTARCRLIAITHVSNVTGAVTDVARVVAAAQRVGARVFLDGAQAVPHGPVDLQALGVDFYAFSGHKCFAPTGVGVLWGRQAALAELTPAVGGGGMVQQVTPERVILVTGPRAFEAGTPPIAQAVGLGAALDWLQTLPWPQLRQHEQALGSRLLAGLQQVEGLRLLGPATALQRLPIFTFVVDGVHPHDICHILDRHGVACRGGHHCAQPLLAGFGEFAATRASLAIYNDLADIDALLAGLHEAVQVLR